MASTDRPLPPLSAIRAFDASARRGSFSLAAEDLGMTQAAVSYQIKQLEDRVGAPLFQRHARGVRLTETGRTLAAKTGEAMEILREGFAEARCDASETLTISALATFATKILAPRLVEFMRANPDIDARIEVEHGLADIAGGEATVGIRGGTPPWPGLRWDFLMHTEYTPVLSPCLMDRFGPIETPSDLLKFPFVEPADPSWEGWFRAAGLPTDSLPAPRPCTYGSQLLEAQAAIAGQGVCLMSPIYIGEAVDRGKLVRPFDIVSRDAIDIWLVYPEQRRNSRAIRAFRSWLLAEMARLNPKEVRDIPA